MGFSGGAGVAPFSEGSAPVPPLTSGWAGGRLWRAHAGWVGAHLCHLRHLWFQLLHLKKTVLSLADNQKVLFPSPLSSAIPLTSAYQCFSLNQRTSWFGTIVRFSSDGNSAQGQLDAPGDATGPAAQTPDCDQGLGLGGTGESLAESD